MADLIYLPEDKSTSQCPVGVNGKAHTLPEVYGLGPSCTIKSSSFSEKRKKEENML